MLCSQRALALSVLSLLASGSGCSSNANPSSSASLPDLASPPSASLQDLAAPPSSVYLFVSGGADSTLHAFDINSSFLPVKTFPVCSRPAEVRARRDGQVVWTVCREPVMGDGGLTYGPGKATFVDARHLQIAATVPVGVRPTHSYVAPDGKTAIVCNDGSDDITLIDTDSFQPRTVPVGKGHHKVALATDGKGGALRFAYVSNIVDATITVLDAGWNKVTTIPVGLSPHGMDYSFVSRKVYNCSGDASHDLEVIDTDGPMAHTVSARIPLQGARCGHLEVSPDGSTVVATQNGANQVAILSVADNAVKYYPAGVGPDWTYFAQGSLWIDDRGAWTVYQINMSSLQGAPMKTGPDLPDGGSVPEGGAGFAGWDPWVFEAQGSLGQVAVINAEHGHVHTTLSGIPGASNCAVGGLAGSAFPR